MPTTSRDLIAGLSRALRLSALAVLGTLGVAVVVLGSVAALIATCAMPLSGLGRWAARPAAALGRRRERIPVAAHAPGLGVLRQDAVRP